MQTLVNFLLSYRHALAILTLLLGGFIAYGSHKTEIDSSYDSILTQDDPYRAEVASVHPAFPPSPSVLFTFLAPDGDIFNFEALRAMQELTDRYTEIDSAVAAGTLLNRRM
ncbi:MAG: hypothetical protein AB8C02_16455, partial [Halioglobus sp.]